MKYFDYKENKQHGRFDFPLEFYHVSPEHPRYNMPYHWHTECEIIRILKGEFLIILDDKKVLVKEDDIVFINAGILHGGIPEDCIYECIVFDMKSLFKENSICTKHLYDIINHNKIIYHKLPNDISDLNSTCNNLFDAMKIKNIGHEFMALGALYSFFGIVFKNKLYLNNDSNIKRSQQKILQFKNVLSLIETNYSTTLTLEDLSKSVGMTPKYFCRFFYDMSNKTPIEYLNFYRIERACYDLITTDLNITEVALNCGFNDISYFIKSFKKLKGITPKSYKKSFG